MIFRIRWFFKKIYSRIKEFFKEKKLCRGQFAFTSVKHTAQLDTCGKRARRGPAVEFRGRYLIFATNEYCLSCLKKALRATSVTCSVCGKAIVPGDTVSRDKINENAFSIKTLHSWCAGRDVDEKSVRRWGNGGMIEKDEILWWSPFSSSEWLRNEIARKLRQSKSINFKKVKHLLLKVINSPNDSTHPQKCLHPPKKTNDG